jgi:hypothetical protein
MCKVIEPRTPNHYRRTIGPATLLLAMALPSCVTADELRDRPLATLAAEHAGELGVATWEVRTAGEAVRVIGLGASEDRQVEMIVRHVADKPDRVQIEAIFPEHGVFELGRGGVVDGAPSDLLQRLGIAVNADLGEHSVTIDPSPEAGLGSTTSAWPLLNEGHIALGWSAFGYSADVDVGRLCPPSQGGGFATRSYAAAYSDRGASCWVNHWISDWPNDCRISVHYGIGGFATDTCNWFVYGDP